MSEFLDGPKPIETHYKGYRFRSRLEARWAVFLDALGTEWVYEKQGYDIDGTWYLPDFWLPYAPMRHEGWGNWIEIKPLPLSEAETNLLAGLARETGHRTYALCGQPWPGEYKVYIFQHHHHGVPERIPILSEGVIVEIDPHAGNEFETMGRCLRVSYQQGSFPFVESYSFWQGGVGGLDRAFRAARQARFEHGEHPVV